MPMHLLSADPTRLTYTRYMTVTPMMHTVGNNIVSMTSLMSLPTTFLVLWPEGNDRD
jgi:hypothetical protein